MTVLVPADGIEAEQMILEAAKYYGPMYVRLGRSAVPTLFDENYKFQIGKGSVLREGNDASIIACGIMVNEAILASEILKSEGINVRVINMSTIKPIDRELIIAASKETGAIVTAEEHSIIGGLGSAVSEVVSEECPVIVKKIGVKDTFGESGTPAELLKKYGLTAEDIVTAVKEAISKK
jgi:transketolase